MSDSGIAAALPADAIAARYGQRAARADAEAAELARRSRRLSNLRLLAAGVAAVAFLMWATGRGGLAQLVIVGIALGMLAWLVSWHARIERRREHAAAVAALNREGRARVERHWDALPPAWMPAGLDDHPYATDLDVFGHASIAQLLGPVHTPTGRRTLRGVAAPHRAGHSRGGARSAGRGGGAGAGARFRART